MSRDYPELLADIAAHVAAALTEGGVPSQTAKEIGFKTAERVRANFKGQLLYIPTGKGFELAQRDRLIWDRFNGDNHEQLAREFGLTVPALYRILDVQRTATRARTQGHLFDSAPVLSSAPSDSTPK